MQIFDILQGWTNFVLNLKTKEAKEKADICFDCEHKRYSNFEIIKDNKIKEISGFICDACICPLSAKLRSGSKCPLKKF